MKNSGVTCLSTRRIQARVIAVLALSLAFAGESFAALKHNYLFNSGNGSQIIDSVGGANGTVFNIDDDPVTGIIPADSRLELGQNRYGNLPGATIGINAYPELTFEMWAAVSTIHANQYTASMAFGNTVGGQGAQYVMMQPTRGGAAGSSGNFLDTAGGAELVIAGPNDLSDGRLHHTVTTITATDMAHYIDGVLIGTQPVGARSLANIATNFAYLGRSVWTGDPRMQGSIYEFRIYDNALNATEVANNFAAGCTDACGDMYLEIDRNTGAATLFNGLSNKDMIISQISSAKGALSPNNWLSITNNYDSNDGSEFDDDDVWEVVSQTNTLLHEQDPIGEGAEDGGDFDNNTSIPLGNIWTKSPFEDVQITITLQDASFNTQALSLPVFFINGINDSPFQRSDLNLDGEIDTDDYLTLRANHLTDLGGTLHIDTFAQGDINGDLVNDYLDFRLFKDDFIAANGAPAFAAMLASVGGAVPEPGTCGLLLLGVAAGSLFGRRKRIPTAVQNSFAVTYCFSKSCRTMNSISKILPMIALLLMIPTVGNAQITVGSQNFDAAPLGDFQASGIPGARYYTFQAVNPFAEIATPGVGGSGNLLRTSVDYPTGQFNVGGAGFQMPITGNISPNRQDYNLEFDIRLVQGTPYNPDGSWIFSVGVMSNFTFAQAGGSNYFLNDVPEINNLTPGGPVQHVVLNLGGPDELFFNESMHWNPVDASNQVAFEFNAIRTPPETVTQIWEIDNVELVLDVAPSLALVVDPTSGRARLRNVAAIDVTFDYYRIESTNGSLRTANFNGTTGWNSLDDQGLGSVGGGIGESWDEVVETNSANRLVEQFLLGETTLAPGQSVGLGAPVNPAILNNQISSLALTLGGPDFANVAFGDVIFEDLSVLIGDYNENGVVDAADYTLWRNRVGQPSNSLPNRDPANSGNIGPSDFASWKANFGTQFGAGGGAQSPVPEPTAAVLSMFAVCLMAGARLQRTK